MQIKNLFFRGVILALCLPLSVSAAEFVAAGEWEFSVKLDVGGMPIEMGTMLYQECLSAESPVPRSFLQASECDIAGLKTLHRTVSWKMTCQTENGRIYNEGKITFHTLKATGQSRSYAGNSLGKDTTVRYNFTGRRLGDCAP